MWGKDELGTGDGVCIVDLSTFIRFSSRIILMFMSVASVIFGGVSLNNTSMYGVNVILSNAFCLSCALGGMVGSFIGCGVVICASSTIL